MRALPICSKVLGMGTSLGRPLGLTFTPLPPMSRTRSTNRLQVSMFSSTVFLLVEWNSQTEPAPQISMPASANFLRTSFLSSGERVGSTLCAWVVRSSTGEIPVVLQTLRSAGRSSFAPRL